MNRRWGVLCVLAWSCSSSSEPAQSIQVRQARLPSGVAAQVAQESVAAVTVARIAQAQRIPAPAARERAVSDALFAAGARTVFAGSSLLPVVERSALARAVLEGMKAEALARGPVTDAEVNELTAIRWLDFDRPESVRTTHAVAMVKTPADDAAARTVAEHIARAVAGVTDPARFIELAKAVPHEGIEVYAEGLPAVTLDGRVVPEKSGQSAGEDRLDVDFAKGAFALAPQQQSGLVKSVFGYHVILGEARLPALRVPLEERRSALSAQILSGRAERAKQELLARLGAATPVMIARSVDDMTSRVVVVE